MAVAIAALVVALGGVAVASPIGGDGKVYLCFDQEGMDTHQSGAVRAVKAGTACPDGFTSFVLNQTGPAGAPGPAGPAGAPGPQGPGGAIKPLPKPVSKDAIDDLKQAGKLADKQKDKLKDVADKLRELEKRRGGKDKAALEAIAQQRRMAEALRQLNEMMRQIAGANRKVVDTID
jgi:hypothetical protein